MSPEIQCCTSKLMSGSFRSRGPAGVCASQDVARHQKVEPDAEYGEEGGDERRRPRTHVKPHIPTDMRGPPQCEPDHRSPKAEPSQECERQEPQGLQGRPACAGAARQSKADIEKCGNDEAHR